MGKAGHHALFGRVRAGPTLLCQFHRSRIRCLADLLEDPHVPAFRHGAFKRYTLGLQEGVQAHDAQTNRPFAEGGIGCALHLIGRALDEVFQHIVEETEDVLDEVWIVLPLHIGLGIERRQTAHSRTVFAQMVFAGVQHDFAAQV